MQSQSTSRALTAKFEASLYFPLKSNSRSTIIKFLSFHSTIALESCVDALLKSAKLKDKGIHHIEEAMNRLSVEEVARRRGELQKIRGTNVSNGS